MLIKACCTCGIEKPLNDFYPDSSKKDGRHYKCKKCTLLYRKVYYSKNKSSIQSYMRSYHISHYASSSHKLNYMSAKAASLQHYGNACACCGETEPMFLTFDHIFNDGAFHRASDKGVANIVTWLVRNDFPDGVVQILCFNCNQAKHLNGGTCPHLDRMKVAA